MSADKSEKVDFKRNNFRLAVNLPARIYLDDAELKGTCIDIDGQALAVELPLHTVQHGQKMSVSIRHFFGEETLRIVGKVNRVDVFTSNLTGEDTLLIVCKFDPLDPKTKKLIDDFISADTVDVASW